jgi:outer membrane cobalamin receptor
MSFNSTIKLLFLAFVVCLLPISAIAHGGTITGIVADNENNLELPGAFIIVKENGRTAVTNELGIFSVTDLESGNFTIVISYIGYKTHKQVVHVNDHETVNIKILLETNPLDLKGIEISANKNNPAQTLSQLDILTRPVNSAQDILRSVPGLFIAQHAGGGKAEQIFLRGFDIDHGTDIALSVDGMPVNMVSHAHGQGYADLHFVIPELVEKVNFQKGTYLASNGNLATAGAVQFHTAEILKSSFLKLEGGQFNSYRVAGAFDLMSKQSTMKGTSAWIGGEGVFSNGYFDAPQDFKRLNIMGKYRVTLDDKQILTLSASAFRSSWLASGQVPERAIASGLITRFGAIDPTEGGVTSRVNLNAELSTAINDNLIFKNQVYTSQYDFELYSNFTFFLNDPVNGDQIRQKENRRISGYNNKLIYNHRLANGMEWRSEAGLQLRYDDIKDIELSRTLGRFQTISNVALGDVQELNAAAYTDQTLEISKRFSINAGLRFDQFVFSYYNKLLLTNAWNQVTKSQVNPKLNLYYQLNNQLQFFVHGGTGFHSNDTRLILGGQTKQILPRAFGWEAGTIARPFKSLLLTLSAWRLDLQQEFVYVGDEGIVEPSGKTLRQGIDVSLRWQPFSWMYIDMDYNRTLPRSIEEPEGAQFIPLAPLQTSIGGIHFTTRNGFDVGLRYRYLGDRPANEDNSLNADGYFLIDAIVNWSPEMRHKTAPLSLFLTVQNLLNASWKEAQFETTSRLYDEPEAITEIHFTPGTPFFVKGGVEVRF